MYDYYFEGKKPSIKQVMAKVNEGIKQNAKDIQISWGENCITISWYANQNKWYGCGWIKTICGSDIADEVNANKTRQTMREHFELLNVWNT